MKIPGSVCGVFWRKELGKKESKHLLLYSNLFSFSDGEVVNCKATRIIEGFIPLPPLFSRFITRLIPFSTLFSPLPLPLPLPPSTSVDDKKMAISNMVTWKDFVYIGTPKFFRAIELNTSEIKFQIDTGVKGMFSKSNLLLGALTDFQILLFNMKTNLPMLLLNGHTNWVASVVIHKQISFVFFVVLLFCCFFFFFFFLFVFLFLFLFLFVF